MQTENVVSRKEKILIVDDAKLMRDFLKNMLNELGFDNFTEAETAAETLNQYQSDKPDIVFLDIELETENGLDVLVDLKKLDAEAKVAIVSAHSTITNVKKAMELGAKGFIVKPYKPKKLVSTIKNLGIEIF
ncbi:response regulator [Catenovulum sp. SM1970]|uniref:response regulator n=1 Tax=Marinifaba aquimaris TaxID=2741323 RepID=UPI001572FEE2|nr:response regulator [Marinifaba aquimaris]